MTFIHCFSNSAFSQINSQWHYIAKDDVIWDFAFENQNAWIATRGGLVKIDRKTNYIAHYNSVNSLMLENEVQSVCIDDSNNIWVGGYSRGLSRFDGTTWTQYITINGIDTINGVRQIEKDRSGNLYLNLTINSTAKLFKYNGSAFIDMNITGLLLAQPLRDLIAVDTLDNIWCAPYNKTLLKYDGNSWLTFDSTNSPIKTNILNIGIDKSNNIWISADSVFKFDGVTWTTITTAMSGISLNQSNLHADNFNNVWFTSLQNNVVKYDGANFSVIPLINLGISSSRIFNLKADSLGHLWMVPNMYADSSVYEFDGNQTLKYFTSNSQLRSQGVFDINFDKDGNRWICNDGRGLQKFDGFNWTSYTLANSGICSDKVYCVQFDNSGNVWVGASDDSSSYPPLSRFDGVSWTNYQLPYFGANPRVQSIKVDQQNNIWFGVWGQGLAKFDGGSWNYYDGLTFGIAQIFLQHLIIDANNNLWATTSGQGLIKFSSGTWTRYTTANSNIPSDYLSELYMDKNGILWLRVGTSVYTFDGNNFTFFNTGAMEGTASCFMEDHLNNFWIGTSKGLAKFDGTNWTNYTFFNSAIGSGIGRIYVDINNTLWMTGGRGIMLFNENGLTTNSLYNIPQTKFAGKVFYDSDNDGQYNSLLEYGMNNQKVYCLNDSSFAVTNFDGNYQIYKPTGYYESKYVPYTNWYITSDSLTYHITIDSLSILGFDYGALPNVFHDELSVSLTFGSNRCNSVFPAWISYQNTGTTIANGTITLVKDNSLIFISSNPIPSYMNGDTLKWSFSNFQPFTSGSIDLIFQNPGFTFIGDTLESVISIEGASGLADREIVIQVILCSFDPNDKSVSPIGFGPQHYVEMGDTLEYTIRFQNLGNDTAFTVFIIDSIPAWMDRNSFLLTGVSHEVFAEISASGLIRFTFDNILLPCSTTNEPGSHGFIKYKLAPLLSMPVNTTVYNKANIFFDLNPPITTNTVFNTYTNSPLSVSQIQQQNISCYPNPFDNYLKIQLVNDQNLKVELNIFNALGQHIHSENFNSNHFHLNSERLSKGFYFFQIKLGKQESWFKGVKL